MKNDNDNKQQIVVKSNRLIEASYRLDLVEQRIILKAIVEARNTGRGINAETFLEVRASDFAATFNTDETLYSIDGFSYEASMRSQGNLWSAKLAGFLLLTM